jgi:molybdate-binding protein
VTLAPVGDVLVALPLSGTTATRTGFLPAGGLVTPAAAGSVQPIGPPRPTLVVAGCDPALPLLQTPLALLDPPVAFAWWPCASSEALRLAAAGLAHVAGAHLQDYVSDDATGAASDLLLTRAEILRFCSWRVGLVLRPGYETAAAGHLKVAAAIAAGVADVGVASEPAALAYALAFVPLTQESFDLVIPAAHAGSHEVRAMIRALSSRWLHDQLASLPGYDATGCGEHPATPRGPLRRGQAVGVPSRVMAD